MAAGVAPGPGPRAGAGTGFGAGVGMGAGAGAAFGFDVSGSGRLGVATGNKEARCTVGRTTRAAWGLAATGVA